MKRRPTLRLSPPSDLGKKHAPGFENATSEQRPKSASNEADERQPQTAAPPRAEATRGQSVTRTSAWPTVKQLTKIFLVVAASALSIYLLKRRFF